MKVVVFEDDATYNFGPLTLTRGSFDLRIGLFSFADRVKHYMQVEQLDFMTRDYIAEYMRKRKKVRANEPDAIDDEAIFVNGLLVFDRNLQKIARKIKPETIVLKGDRILIARLSETIARELAPLFTNAPGPELLNAIKNRFLEKIQYEEALLITHFWDLIERNGLQISDDYETMPRLKSRIPAEVSVIGKRKNLYIGRDSDIAPYVVFNVEEGPVYVGERCEIGPWSYIEGPAYIGPETVIHPLSVIRRGSNIGAACRVGGEVEETIIQGYSNKQHSGFLGHSYVGEWVNLGASFTNSDLKNTYGSVRVMVRGKRVDSGKVKLGSIIADHVKASIGTLLYTGRKIGVSSIVGGTIIEDVPSFIFYEKTREMPVWEIDIEEAIKIARRMMSRRKVELTIEDEQLLRKVFEITREERESIKPRKGVFKYTDLLPD